MTSVTLRIRRLWSAVAGSALTELETDHAGALLDLEREQLRRQVAEYNRGLAGHAALCERLRRAISRLEREAGELEAHVEARIAGDDRERAARDALRLEEVQADLEEQRRQLDGAERTFRDLVRSRDVAVEAARRKIEGLKRSIGELQVQRALAELTEMAAGLHGAIGVDEVSLDRLKEKVEDRRDFAVGRVRVAREAVDQATLEADDAAERALAEAALTRFEARRGGAAGGAPESEAG